ncbi:hypothetical protein ABWH93_15280 [Seohaeicola saemankumensis]|uniref:hypothetical protein n=1 Tax=Seohaeicola TaxID=481178 RepID=UPI0035CFAABA
MDASNEWVDTPQVEEVTAAAAQAEIKRLATLNLAEYEGERRAAAKRLGWRPTFLDDEVNKIRARHTGGNADQDTATAIETVEIWPDPVDGAFLAEEIRHRLKAHVVFGACGDADCATLWIIGSYLMDTWRLWPRLLVTSPTKACGKSTLLEVIDAMAHRGFIVSNASPAAIFRAIEAWQPTLLLDEADTWMKQNEELAGVLNSGQAPAQARGSRARPHPCRDAPSPICSRSKADARNHPPDGPKTGHALTIKLNQSDQAAHPEKMGSQKTPSGGAYEEGDLRIFREQHGWL